MKRFVQVVCLILLSALLCGCSGAAVPSLSLSGAVDMVGALDEGEMAVSFLDVGQGDSIFIELPNGKTMLIDAGPSECGDEVVSYITGKGYDTIDYLIASHPHTDHVGGLSTVIDDMKIGLLYMPKVSLNTWTYAKLLLSEHNKGLTAHTAKAGVVLIDEDGLKVSFIAPCGTGYQSINNYSAVIKLVYKNTSFLLMADAETVSESEITADVTADVLKVGHHGCTSSTGEEFLEKVSPKYAVISVGQGNPYGYPDQAILDKLQNIGAQVYRTDMDGTVVMLSDGETITVVTETSSENTSVG